MRPYMKPRVLPYVVRSYGEGQVQLFFPAPPLGKTVTICRLDDELIERLNNA
jgi:hypothetical protein